MQQKKTTASALVSPTRSPLYPIPRDRAATATTAAISFTIANRMLEISYYESEKDVRGGWKNEYGLLCLLALEKNGAKRKHGTVPARVDRPSARVITSCMVP